MLRSSLPLALLLLSSVALAQAPAPMTLSQRARFNQALDGFDEELREAETFSPDDFADEANVDPLPPTSARVRLGAWLRRAIESAKIMKGLEGEGVDIAPLADRFRAINVKVKAVQTMSDADMACRRSQPCLNDRWAKRTLAATCGDIALRAGSAEELRREKANPSGVVDLRKLHDLGATIQEADARIATNRRAFLSQLHRPMPACPPATTSPAP